MPNYVNNDIKVYGKNEDLKEFKKDVALNDEIVFSFSKFSVKPEDTSPWAANSIPGRSVWRLENLGTNYDCVDSELNEEKDHLKYKFITAWNAPYPIYEKMIETYKKLYFEIDACDPWAEWAVEIATSGGELIKHKVHDRDFVQWTKEYYICIEYIRDVLNNNTVNYSNSYLCKAELVPSFN